MSRKMFMSSLLRQYCWMMRGANFKHLANINKERLVRALCLMEGYSDKIEMRDPMGVIGDD